MAVGIDFCKSGEYEQGMFKSVLNIPIFWDMILDVHLSLGTEN
jgi:hypothetical protein